MSLRPHTSGLPAQTGVPHLDWLNPLKAFALLAIMLNHFVEEFGSGPWFTNPSQNWPDFSTRIGNVFPTEHPFPISLVQFLGWLGDSGPGVFILASGFGLMWSAVHRPSQAHSPWQFYQRRLVRIFPQYLAAHFLILFLALFVPGSDLTLSSPKTFLSLLGLRFTDGLFFYINPSWWFVWLLLQFYLLFPFLYRVQKRTGVRNFLLLALAVTFVCRIAGITGIRYSDNLYYWMTGIFFGTRLAEFAVGMVLAVYFHRILNSSGRLPPVLKIAGVSVFAYVLGLLASFTWPGTVVSNVLVTVGMSGLFYTAWVGIFKNNRVLASAITWIGIESYAIYLVHQPPLKWTAGFYGGNDALHLLSATIVLGLSFPVGAMLNRVVEGFTGLAPRALSGKIAIRLTWVFGLFAVPLLLLIETKLQNPYLHRHLSLFLGVVLVVLLYLERGSPLREKALGRLIRWASITGLLAALFVLPANYGYVALAAAGVFSVIAVMLYHYFGMRRILAWITSGTVCIIFAIVLELSLSYLAPIEAGSWGELPALEVHPTRVYGLKPDISVRLKYNNYNYVLKTNAHGLASPEIPVERPIPETFRVLIIGDAFSMPEGMAYQCAYPALLEQKLKHCLGDRPVQVINAGVTGYGPVEQLPQLEELLPLYNPDIVIYQFFINEYIEVAIEPEDRLRNIGLLQKSHNSRDLIQNTQLMAYLRNAKNRFSEWRKGTPGQWRFSKSLLKLYNPGPNPHYSAENINRLRSYLARMEILCKKFRSEFVVLFVPGAVAVSDPKDIAYFPWGEDLADTSKYDMNRPNEVLKSLTTKLRIDLLDLTDTLRRHSNQPVYFEKSWHWNKEGHRLVSNALSSTLCEREKYASR